ncbi:hypothetical protein QYE76_026844 [Lolium multiflorum]|uniref:Uncharacterized protein n=1 Tax=Lolium multiflorum TaxID=4521 RepID=A0AAD8RJC9_LOLMU|nr:hypothetical protein QYE76_026844 [Lolium multiflorum]
MSAHNRSTASPASGSKRSRSPDTVDEAWRLQCKRFAAGSRRAACRYAGASFVPPKLREFAPGGLWYKEDPPVKPMSGPKFEEWRERHRRAKAAWDASIGSTSGGGAPLAGEEEEEEEDPDFLKTIEESLKDDAEKKRAEEEDKAAAIAAVKEAKADAYIVDLSD